MLWLLKWLIIGHIHRWKTIEKCELRNTIKGVIVERGERYIQQCEKCGIVIKRDLI